MKEAEYQNEVMKKVESNAIWINALEYVGNVSVENKIKLADSILGMLNKKDNLLPASFIVSDDKNMQEMAKLTQVLYLSISRT